MRLIRSWVRGRSFGVWRKNIPITAPICGSTLITKTFSSLPTKRAQPLFAGRIPRICTGTTSFFMSKVYRKNKKTQVTDGVSDFWASICETPFQAGAMVVVRKFLYYWQTKRWQSLKTTRQRKDNNNGRQHRRRSQCRRLSHSALDLR